MSVVVPPEPVTVIGDSKHLERLVLNLVSNAVKFTDPGGSVRVGARGAAATSRSSA